jgi:hypothetical protein
MEQMESSKDLFGIQEDFQQLRGEAHEQELMIFAAVEYDAGASLHVSQPASHASHVSAHAFKAEERRSLI